MRNGRVVGVVCALVAFAAMVALLYFDGRISREVQVLLTFACIGCCLRGLVSMGKVQEDEDFGEMGDARPANYGFSSRIGFGILGAIVACGVSFISFVDELEERGRLSEVRALTFVLAFFGATIAVLKLPSWGFSLPFFSVVFLTATCSCLVYFFSRKSGIELN